jgi:hypothetical protein
MSKYVICQSFKKFHRAVFSIAHPKYSNFGGILDARRYIVILVSEDSNCDNFPQQFYFFLGAIHEKHKFKYFKNLTVKVCKIWWNDVNYSV